MNTIIYLIISLVLFIGCFLWFVKCDCFNFAPVVVSAISSAISIVLVIVCIVNLLTCVVPDMLHHDLQIQQVQNARTAYVYALNDETNAQKQDTIDSILEFNKNVRAANHYDDFWSKYWLWQPAYKEVEEISYTHSIG